MKQSPKTQPDQKSSGKLRIGDQWNAITIIALSQSNPLKAVAEFVENSIDAKAKRITIVRGKERGEPYLAEPHGENQIGLYRSGTRVLENITQLASFQGSPWNSGYFQGILDAPFLNLTPGTRLGIIQDEAYATFCQGLGELEKELIAVLEEQKKAEQEQTSRQTLRSIQRAFREALLALPEEEYDWFRLRKVGASKEGVSASKRPGKSQRGLPLRDASNDDTADGQPTATEGQEATPKEFFEHSGPLASVRISPTTCVVSVGKTKNLRAVARDRNRRQVENKLVFQWAINEGEGSLDPNDAEIVTLTAPGEPALTKVGVTVTQGDMVCQAEALVTVTDSLLPEKSSSDDKRGLPGYTFQKAPGELWRSRYDNDQNVIVINNGHRDFVYASRQKALKLRYVCRLFSKELVLRNFPGTNSESLLERMIELSLYTEENLR